MKNKPTHKPIASLSLDLDNKWSYLRTRGDPVWKSFPSYLDLVVPRFLKFLEELNLKTTVFVVGQDAAIERNHPALRMIADQGHEIGNHSFHHEPWLHLYTREQLNHELELAEGAIEQATGQRTSGFRGPGFSFSAQTLDVLVQRGYTYDCSTLPTFLGPLARAYFFRSARLTQQQRDERKNLFGGFFDGFQPNQPYVWQSGRGRLLEIPVTTFPLIKSPIHASYLLYLSKYSQWAAKSYLWTAIRACRLTGIGPSMLLHPLDFLGAEDDADLAFFPAMNLRSNQKLKLLKELVSMMLDQFEVVSMRVHAEYANSRPLKVRSIQLARSGRASSPS